MSSTSYINSTQVGSYLATAGQTLTVNLGAFPISFAGTSGNDTFSVAAAATTNRELITAGGVTYNAIRSQIPSLAFAGSGGNDSLALDASVLGFPPGLIVTTPISYTGDAGTDSVTITNTNASQDLTVNGTQLNIASNVITMATVESIFLDAASNSTIALRNLTVSSGTLSLIAGKNLILSIASLTINAPGALNLGDNDMIVSGGTLGVWNGTNYTGILGLLKSGRGSGSWTGTGINASSAGSIGRFALGASSASTILGISGSQTGTWEGQTVSAGAVLVKFTYAGDTTLDGKINGDDYFRIDSGFSSLGTGYASGDLDYSGKIDADDYFLIDSNYGHASMGAIAAADARPGGRCGRSRRGMVARRERGGGGGTIRFGSSRRSSRRLDLGPRQHWPHRYEPMTASPLHNRITVAAHMAIEALERRVLLDGAALVPYETKEPVLPGDPGFPAAFQLQQRWTSTASGPVGAIGTGVRLTWSIVPDGTTLTTGVGEPNTASDLQAHGLTPSTAMKATWMPIIQQVFSEWSSISGVTFVQTTDDGIPYSNFNANGALGVRGDIRIGGHPIDGALGTLAYTWFPDFGDIVLDSSDLGDGGYMSDTSDNSLKLRNVMAHELGHALGLNHVDPTNQTKLMEAFTSTHYDGPQFDDMAAINTYYGDVDEKGSGDNTAATAVDFGTLPDGTDALTNLSLSTIADVDFYKFTIDTAKQEAVNVAPYVPTYLQ